MKKDNIAYLCGNINTNWIIKNDALLIEIRGMTFTPVFKISDWQKMKLLEELPFLETTSRPGETNLDTGKIPPGP